ncbi:MAG: amylo-alpha-1,6-glucosidase [Anaerolineae bacterium]|nr:amylo-alpha-1,6-glucosidase [Anaerolineae bacterium]
MIELPQNLLAQPDIAVTREWLVTNGIGGYASGTVAGMLTRRYHGLLVAALRPPVERTLLLTKFDETATYRNNTYALFSNRWRDGQVEPEGCQYLQRFHLEGTVPVWTFSFADVVLEKRIWMEPGFNTTYVRYDLCRASENLTLDLKALVNYRDHHGNTHAADWEMQLLPVEHGLLILARQDAVPFYILSSGASFRLAHTWIHDFYLDIEAYRGYDELDDNLNAGVFTAELAPGAALTLVASTDPAPNLDGETAYMERHVYEIGLVVQAGNPDNSAIHQLVLAADQFIVQRSLPYDMDGRTIIAGYPWFTDWGRDTMISLPGLTLATGRYAVARRILLTFAHFVDQGMLPNRFPDAGEAPEYNTVDATLWYFEAVRAYYAATEDKGLLQELFPVLVDIISCHQRGTRYNIHVDPVDGLLYAGEDGVQLTWMDAKVEDWVVTPRIGKPVEINALWFHALLTMAEFARILGEPDVPYTTAAECVGESFSRFWNPELNCCYDVLDGPDGDAAAIRPNQIFAVSLLHSPLSPEQQRAVVEVCEQHLLTPYGLRSLAPGDAAYIGHYGGDLRTRDAAYHQGTTWGWLIGPFVTAHLRVYQDKEKAYGFLQPLLKHLETHAVGSLSEIFDGDAPFTPRGCYAQAWTVAELLRVLRQLESR